MTRLGGLVPRVAASGPDRQRSGIKLDHAGGTDLGGALSCKIAIGLAKAYPHLRVDGYDSDEASISAARRNAAEAGVADRVTFDVVDASGGYGEGRYDLVLFFECVHDMAHPVEAMAQARAAVAEGGQVVVMDERVAETLTIGEPTEIFFATASVLWCLPQGRVEPDSQAVGTVMRPDRFREIVRDAGWTDIEILGIDHPFWRSTDWSREAMPSWRSRAPRRSNVTSSREMGPTGSECADTGSQSAPSPESSPLSGGWKADGRAQAAALHC